MSARSRRSPSARRTSAAAESRVATQGDGQRTGSAFVFEDDRLDTGRVERRQHRVDDGADERRHVTADDEDDRFVGGAKASRDSGERALEGDRVVDQPRTGGEIRGRIRGGDDEDLGRGRGDAVDGAVEKGPAVDPFGQLVSSEAARSAAGKHEAGDASGGHGAVTGRSCGPWARDVAVRGPPEDPAPIEILEDGHHVLAARPGRIAKRRRGERRGRRRA